MNSIKKKPLACSEAERDEPVMPGLHRIFKDILGTQMSSIFRYKKEAASSCASALALS